MLAANDVSTLAHVMKVSCCNGWRESSLYSRRLAAIFYPYVLMQFGFALAVGMRCVYDIDGDDDEFAVTDAALGDYAVGELADVGDLAFEDVDFHAVIVVQVDMKCGQ